MSKLRSKRSSLRKKQLEVQRRFETEDTAVMACNAKEVHNILRSTKNAEMLPSSTIRYLRQLVITLVHEPPPQHNVESSPGAHVPSQEEREEFVRLLPPGKTIKQGSFSPEEDQLIVDNWKQFCKLHRWQASEPQPFLFLRQYNQFYMPKLGERKKFLQFLARGLPNRTLYSVYHRFRNLYYPHKVTNYTEDEDSYIISYIEHSENVDKTRMFADLAKVLNRTRASVWRRYRLLKRKRM